MRKFLLWVALLTPVFSSFVQAEDLTEIGSVGGSGGTAFIDTVPAGATVTALSLCGAKKVDSVQFFYSTGPGAKHGGYGGTCVTTFLSPGEFIGNVWGYINGGVIYRLRFDTNLGRQIAVGDTAPPTSWNFAYGDNTFLSPSSWTHQIVGLKGRSGDRIDAIGVLIRGHGNGVYTLTGPAVGAPNAFHTYYGLDSGYTSYIEACGGAKLDSLTINSTKAGGSGGTCSRLYLSNGEKITEISGYAGTVIEYVEIRTSYGQLLVAGHAQTKNFAYKGTNALKIYGTYDRLIDSIGVNFY